MNIRIFEQKDIENVKNLISSIIEDEFAIEATSYNYNDLDNISDEYGGARNVFYVGEEGGDIVGTIAIKEDDKDTALLRRVFIDKNKRQKGYGSKLLKHALDFAKENDYKRIVFRSTNRMTAAINLALKKGFVERNIIDMGDYKIFMLEKTL